MQDKHPSDVVFYRQTSQLETSEIPYIADGLSPYDDSGVEQGFEHDIGQGVLTAGT